MPEFSIRSLPMAAVLAGLAGLLSSLPVQAATIYVPPVTINQLLHQNLGTGIRDYVPTPGPGYYTSSGFTATLTQGDHVVVKYQAPEGKIFQINDVNGSGVYFSVWGRFGSRNDPASMSDPFTTTFLEFSGSQPSIVYTDVRMSDCGAIIDTHEDFTFHGTAHFTAIVFDIMVSRAPCYGSQTFGPVGTSALLLQGSQSFTGLDVPIVEIVDATPTAAHASTWGRLKFLYR